MLAIHLKRAAHAARRHSEINAKPHVVFRLTRRLDDLAAALAQRRPPAVKSEADHKRELVGQINYLGGRARRIEDRYGTGILDMMIKLPDIPMVLAEAKLIDGNQFAPKGAQFEEGKRWEAAKVKCVLIGWKKGQMFLSAWVEKAHIVDCFTAPGLSDAQALMEYLR